MATRNQMPLKSALKRTIGDVDVSGDELPLPRAKKTARQVRFRGKIAVHDVDSEEVPAEKESLQVEEKQAVATGSNVVSGPGPNNLVSIDIGVLASIMTRLAKLEGASNKKADDAEFLDFADYMDHYTKTCLQKLERTVMVNWQQIDCNKAEAAWELEKEISAVDIKAMTSIKDLDRRFRTTLGAVARLEKRVSRHLENARGDLQDVTSNMSKDIRGEP